MRLADDFPELQPSGCLRATPILVDGVLRVDPETGFCEAVVDDPEQEQGRA